MTEGNLRKLDLTSATLLLLWAGAGLGFGALSAPLLFRMLPRDTAATVAGALVASLDMAALVAFGLALLLVGGSRWLGEIEDPLPIGPLRLWTATAFMAVLMSALSAFIITPRIRALRAAHQGQVSELPTEHPDRQALTRNHKLSTQVFLIRLLLAGGLAWGVGRLPRAKKG